MELARLCLHLGIGLTMASFGAHQLARPQAWFSYMPGWLRRLLPLDEHLFMRLHGALNLLLGSWLISGLFAPIIGWLSLIWWLSILPFAFYYDWRDGLRDLSIIAGLIAYLALL